MEYIGIDLHRKYFVAHIETKTGSRVGQFRYDNTVDNVGDLLTHCSSSDIQVVIEATRNWMWLAQTLESHHCQVHLAHPYRTKAIAAARIKTDSIDAKTLCQLLRADLIPPAYLATPTEQEHRELIRYRIQLIKDRTKVKNRMRAILAKYNLTYTGSGLFGKHGKTWMANQSMGMHSQHILEHSLARIQEINTHLKEVDTAIIQQGRMLPEVSLLESIPTIGSHTAFLLAVEIGNISRFPSAKHLASYFGLVPRLSQSGDHAYYGRITKNGNPYVRWALVQTVHRLCRWNSEYRRVRDRLAYRMGKKKATVAIARRLLVLIYAMLNTSQPYEKDYMLKNQTTPKG